MNALFSVLEADTVYGYVPEFGDSNTGFAGAQPDFFSPGTFGIGEVSIVSPDEITGYETGAAAVAGAEYEPANAGFERPDAGYASADAGYEGLNAGYESSDAGYESSDIGYEGSDTGYEISNLGYETSNTGYETSDAGYGPSDAGYEGSDLGYEAAGYGTGEVLSAVGSGEPIVYQEFQIRQIHLSSQKNSSQFHKIENG